MILNFMNRLAAGILVFIDPDEMSIGNARVQIHKYDSLARCVLWKDWLSVVWLKTGN